MGSKREQIAALVASCLADGSFVNVGIGLPGMVPAEVPDERGVYFHAEHGVLGFGAAALDPRPGATVLDFFSNQYTLRPGAAIVDHPTSFALVRRGLLDVTVLGAFEVAADGSFAGHQNDVMPSAGVGGAPELAGSSARVIVALEHTTSDGRPRVVDRCRLAVGLTRRADLVVSELGVFEPLGDAFRALRLNEGVTLADVQQVTPAPVVDDTGTGTGRAGGPSAAVRPPQRVRVDRRRSKLTDLDEAVAAIRPGMTVALGGWGGLGTPERLITALAVSGVTDLTVVCAGLGSMNVLIAAGCVRHAITSFASYAGRNTPSAAFDELCRDGRVTVELCSQGVLAERLRAGGAALGGVYVAEAAMGRFHATDQRQRIDGVDYRFEPAIRADVSLVRASVADPFGNLSWIDGERNYNEPVAHTGSITLAEADRLVELGEIEPAAVMVPGVVIDHVVGPEAG